jgi:NAD(P)H dehydrogenase (quinone)
MRVLIVHAHHEPRSFNGAMTERAVRALREAGHEVEVSDLYAMGFDPVSDRRNFTGVKDPAYLKQQVEEMHATATNGFAADIAEELAKIERCDALIFQFPLWWFGLPAILKGWVDRVFAAGRAYGGGRWFERGAFAGKRAMIAMTTGGPPSMFNGYGLDPSLETILRPIQHGIFWFTGFDPLPPFIAYAPARATPEERAATLEAYARRVERIFDESPIRYVRLDECDESFRQRFPRFMVHWRWIEPSAADGGDTVTAERLDVLIAEERETLRAWMRDGILLDRSISADECEGWLLLRVADRAELDRRLASLPLRRWLDCTMVELKADPL